MNRVFLKVTEHDQASGKIHSYYTRTLADLSCFGQDMCWFVQVRRFFCRNPACGRKIFTERLPTCAAVYARHMLRQAETLCALAFALGGKVGEQIAEVLGMTTSHDTLLLQPRYIMRKVGPVLHITGSS